jgi:DNA repair exonuclease SbcCD ATPase subunit
MLLKELDILNCRKVKQASLSFHGPGLQVIQGENGSGKSTIVQAIQLSLEGPKAFTPGMITLGETQAEVIAITDDGVKIKTQISGGTVKQTVSQYDSETSRYVTVSGGVRTFLEGIRSGFEMPWAMRDMTDAKIIEILKDRTGITQKINEIDVAKKDKEILRTEIGREKKSLGDLGPEKEKIKHPDPIDELQKKREAAKAYLQKEADILQKAASYIREHCSFDTIDDIAKIKSVAEAAFKCAQDKVKDDKKYTKADQEELDRQYNAWLEIEQKALAFDEYKKKKDRIEELDRQYNDLTEEIEALREQRKKTLAGMKVLKGLEVTEENTLKHNGAIRGITDTNKVGNWSTAESIQVFFSIAARFAGEIKVIVVDNAESLDSKTTEIISNWAETAQFLVLLLKVADVPENLEDGIVYIREGEVVTK